MIEHVVAFRLSRTADEEAFLRRARDLASIDGVRDFRIMRQVGTHSDFTHALSMRFERRADFEAYREHPDRERFVSEIWLRDVADVIELDLIEIGPE